MKTYLTYGVGIAVGSGIWLLLLFLFGFHSDLHKYVWAERAQTVSVLIPTIGIWLALRQIRESASSRTLSYGRCVGAGVLVALVCGLATAPITYAYATKINPDFTEIIKQKQLDAMREANLPDAVLEQQEKRLDRMLQPVVMTVITPVGTIFQGLIISLLLGMTMVQRLRVSTLTMSYAAVGLCFGFFQGIGAGLLKHAALATGLQYALIGVAIGALVPLLLLKLTKYEPRVPTESPDLPPPLA